MYFCVRSRAFAISLFNAYFQFFMRTFTAWNVLSSLPLHIRYLRKYLLVSGEARRHKEFGDCVKLYLQLSACLTRIYIENIYHHINIIYPHIYIYAWVCACLSKSLKVPQNQKYALHIELSHYHTEIWVEPSFLQHFSASVAFFMCVACCMCILDTY